MPTAVTASSDGVWVANTGDGTVSRVDTVTNRVTKTIWVGVAPRALASADGSLWVLCTGSGTLSRIDSASGKVTVVRRGLNDPLALTIEGHHAWITTGDGELMHTPL